MQQQKIEQQQDIGLARCGKNMARKKRRKSTVNSAGNYTKPKLRARLFRQIKAGTKGGRKGQWSARKAQLLARKYKAAGGGYK